MQNGPETIVDLRISYQCSGLKNTIWSKISTEKQNAFMSEMLQKEVSLLNWHFLHSYYNEASK